MNTTIAKIVFDLEILASHKFSLASVDAAPCGSLRRKFRDKA